MTNKNIYKDHLKTFEENADFNVSGKYKQQGSYLNSRDFNDTMSFTEVKLNDLYEKTRMIEDIQLYVEEAVKNDVQSKREAFYDLLKSAEKERDRTKTDGFILKEVSLLKPINHVIRDRDGSVIEDVAVHNQMITLDHGQTVTIRPDAMHVERQATPFNITGNLTEDAYRVFYMLEAPATNGVSENVILTLPTAEYVTQVKSENVKVDNYTVTLIKDGVQLQVQGDPVAGFRQTECDQVAITIEDNTFRKVTYEYDSLRVSSDFWNVVGQNELAIETSSGTIRDIEEANGMAQYNKEYDEYEEAHRKWREEKEAVEARNQEKQLAYELAYAQYEYDMANPEIIELFETIKKQVLTGYQKSQKADWLYDGKKTTIKISKGVVKVER